MPGALAAPQFVSPQLVTPTRRRVPPLLVSSGPPLSPRQVSRPPARGPAPTIVGGLKSAPQVEVIVVSETIGSPTPSSAFDTGPPGVVHPCPMATAGSPGS